MAGALVKLRGLPSAGELLLGIYNNRWREGCVVRAQLRLLSFL